MHVACSMNRPDFVQLLLNFDCDPHQRDDDGNFPLQICAFHGHIKCMKYLIDYVREKTKERHKILSFVNQRSDKKLLRSSPLLFAATEGRYEAVKMLTKNGADINLLDDLSENSGM